MQPPAARAGGRGSRGTGSARPSRSERGPDTPDARAVEHLQAVTRWALQVQLAGEMPSLPSQNSTLRAELLASKAYLDLLMQVSDRLGAWIVQAQADGDIDAGLPPELVLYTIYARACDPVPAIKPRLALHLFLLKDALNKARFTLSSLCLVWLYRNPGLFLGDGLSKSY